ncbi:MAG: glycoside hydrolase family 43 protein [Petrimonas sp.]|jgi:GH43 family beta-xylosidase
MRNIIFIVFVFLTQLSFSQRLEMKADFNDNQVHDLKDIHIRDPYILADKKTKTYYLYRSSSVVNEKGEQIGGVEAFVSKDLKKWYGPKRVFTVPSNNWINGRVWAPEVHFYRGKYYLFATLNSSLTWKKAKEDWPAYTFRGTQIFYSDNPEGPFLHFDLVPHTPIDNMALDGTLWEEDGKPYMIYCHEWVEIVDGTMNLVELKSDLSAPVGQPIRLFNASSAPWVPDEAKNYVTDGCFLYRTKNNKLLMIWSSFSSKGYAVGIAESTTGRVIGPWKQHETPLLNENGGHGMIFTTFDEKICLILHQPNSPGGSERALIYELEDTGDSLAIKSIL